MKTAAIELLFGLLLAAAIAVLAFFANARMARAEARASAAEIRANRLQAELQQAQLSQRVVTEYVDRVRVVQERGQTIIKEVPTHVTPQADAACPVPVGFVRVHNAAAQNLPVDSTTGNPDAPAPGVALSTVASTVTDNYTTCHATAAQLTALQDWVRGLQAIETP